MPSRNVVKTYLPESYYHVYSRGINKQKIFHDREDYRVFLSLFKRYLSLDETKNSSRHTYEKYSDRIELLSYALLPNHLHLLIYQHDADALKEFMKALMVSYSMYFNKKHSRCGPLFQSRYLASLVDADGYLLHISRYIHLNPSDWAKGDRSSIDFYTGKRKADWINTTRILAQFRDRNEYIAFLKDYEEQKKILDELKWELASE
jgi:putative transposase